MIVKSQIKNIIFSQDFPWTFNEYCVDPPAPQITQFTHVFFWNNVPRETYPILKPLIDKINPKSIGKIKANLNLKTEKILETGIHTDTVDERFTSGIFLFLSTTLLDGIENYLKNKTQYLINLGLNIL